MLAIAFLAAIWLISLAIEDLRTARFLAFLTLASVAYVLVEVVAPQPIKPFLELLIPLSVLVVAVLAERLGLGAMTKAEHDLDLRVSRIMRETDGDPPNHAARIERFDDLLRSPPTGVDPRWMTALRLLRRSARRSEAPRLLHPTHPGTFSAAAKRYLRELQRGRSLGGKSWLRTIDEDGAVRMYLEDFRELIPRQVMTANLVGVGPWIDEASAVVQELEELPIDHASVATVRGLVVDVLSRELQIWSGDHSDEAKAEYEEASQRLGNMWVTVEP